MAAGADYYRQVLGQYQERFGAYSGGSAQSRFAESLLILGLEGSRDETSTLWVFKDQKGVGACGQAPEVGRVESEFAVWMSNRV